MAVMKLMLALAFSCASIFAQSFSAAAALDTAIGTAIREDKLPGAVLLIGHEGRVVYRKAYGNRSLSPSREPMTVDTIFDIASLTKVVATTSGMMKLVEQGKVAVDDPVTKYLPEFQGGNSEITVRNLMTHFSGLRPDVDIDPVWNGYGTGIGLALNDKPAGPPGTRFVYSDINFILLGEIIRRVGGLPENEYISKILLEPLGMKDSSYLPPPSVRSRIAPTEMQKNGTILRGVVHDPTARFMGGVAGHAGLFSTADDLGKFCQMLLDGGNGVFTPAVISQFTTSNAPSNQKIQRGLGWDIDSPYSGSRGNLFPIGSFGHTGFTGTSIWIDPASKSYVILLANAVHPHLRGAITPLRRQVATLAATGLGYAAPAKSPTGSTRTGLDVLAAEGFAPFRGKRIGLITNQSGIDREGRRNVDLMNAAGINVAALFSPEHGFSGTEDREGIGHTVDRTTGLKVWSLYGKTQRPTGEMLKGLDALVFDIQDIGVRFYTYTSTMLYAMEAAAKSNLPFFVLDRPNPLTGLHVEGPMLDRDKLSFVGAFPLPLRHGLTIGELAKLFNGEKKLGADLHVMELDGWKRSDWFDQTGQRWVNPSPNIPALNTALLYPGVAMLEYSENYTVGRGTEAPFQQVGAEWIRGEQLASALNARDTPGVRFYPVTMKPTSSHLAGKTVEGVGFVITNREAFSASRFGLELATALATLYPGKIDFKTNWKLIGNDATINALTRNSDPQEVANKGLDDFLRLREKYLIYR
jgi:uncharacterized protein YbbC (DUF1343 family)/CubicO group peptidase (beta-lactamase class C family)